MSVCQCVINLSKSLSLANSSLSFLKDCDRKPFQACFKDESYSKNIFSTIQDVLCKKLGLSSHRPAKKPGLTQKQIGDRLSFCLKYRDKTAEWWARVLFSDESTFRVSAKIGGMFVRRARCTDRYNPRYTTRRVRVTLTEGVTVWGCFGGNYF